MIPYRVKVYARERAKMFWGSAASGVALALIEAAEKALDIQLGIETKMALAALITSPFIYWPSNDPKRLR